MTVDRVEIKDVSLPETMKRSMARQAEATRDRRARVINADAELQASKKLAEAAEAMSDQPAALQLRLLQTVVAVAAEKNSTLVLPFPVELLRFLERSGLQAQAETAAAEAERGAARRPAGPAKPGVSRAAVEGGEGARRPRSWKTFRTPRICRSGGVGSSSLMSVRSPYMPSCAVTCGVLCCAGAGSRLPFSGQL